MPFDHKRGEFIPELGPHYIVVPVSKWGNSPLLNQAKDHAEKAFAAAGAILPLKFGPDDVLVQEYPELQKIVFMFQHRISGEDYYVSYTFDLPDALIAELRALGLWAVKQKAKH